MPKRKTLDQDHGEEEEISPDEDIDESGDEESQEDDNNDDDEDDEESSMENEIQVDFEAFPPEDDDFDGIKRLLKQIFFKEDINLSSLTEALIRKKDITCVIKQASEETNGEEAESTQDEDEDVDDEEVYGVSSFLDIRDANILGLKDVVSLLLQKLQQSSLSDKDKKALNDILESKEGGTAWIINERFVNLPPQLSLPCFDSLLKDLNQSDPKINHCFMICKIMKMKMKKSKSNKKKKIEDEASSSSRKDNEFEDEIMYQNPEEELFVESICKSSSTFDYSVANQCDSDARSGNWDEDDLKLIPFRRVIFLTMSQLVASVESMRKELTTK